MAGSDIQGGGAIIAEGKIVVSQPHTIPAPVATAM
jgi:hypothetical protein